MSIGDVTELITPYAHAAWLVHTREPSRETKEIIEPRIMQLRAEYPMAPGIELEYLDDATPADILRTDHIARTGAPVTVYRDPLSHAFEDRLVFSVHGGGYVRGNGPYSRCGAMIHLRELGLPAACLDYRLLPEHPLPAALDDVEAAWRLLTDELGYAADRILLAGDSAGGQLALSLALRLRDAGEQLPMGMALYSPAVDLSFTSPSHVANVGRDTIFPQGLVGYGTPNAGGADIAEPDFSPVNGDMRGLPPTYLCAEDTEVMASDTLRAAERMALGGVEIRCHMFHGLWHAFPVMHPAEPLPPESSLVFAEIAELFGLPGPRAGRLPKLP
ncbi:alpha/beta hydrolase [Microbacterium sp. NPDC077644]|uniref:alpha/beta hydrolase n=1 Tax=Microbacterium sp. NPDC077644 TaxID=3155055 RepID=UPI00344FB174